MRLPLPDIPDAENTPLVRQLADIIYLQHEHASTQLKDEIARLKGLKARPQIAPSSLRHPRSRLVSRVRNGPVPPSARRPHN